MKTSESVTVANTEVGIETLGDLVLYTDWRPPFKQAKDRSPGLRFEEDIVLPLAGIRVVPNDVIYWDDRRPNSLKRFRYMMSLRAHPASILGGEGVDNLLDRMDNTELAGQVGYMVARQSLVMVIRQFVAGNIDAGHYKRSNLHVLFNYQPPTDKAALKSLHEYINAKAS